MNILITGSAGFIGHHLSKHLLEKGYDVIGLDNMNKYYDINLKIERNNVLRGISGKMNNGKYIFNEGDIRDKDLVSRILGNSKPVVIINLAAQAGVRYSIENPQAYIDSNIDGFSLLLELAKQYEIKLFIYASSSSVYGLNSSLPFKETDKTDQPASLYGATKKANELIAHSYSHLYEMKTIGLRFFTVYGPWGRPDMALFKFTKNIIEGEPIDLYNNGDMIRDFTYIQDIIISIGLLLEIELSVMNDSNKSSIFEIFNIGNSNPCKLLKYVESLELQLNKKAIKNMLPMQPGDVRETYADVTKLENHTGYRPTTSVDDGIYHFVEWYKSYKGIEHF